MLKFYTTFSLIYANDISDILGNTKQNKKQAKQSNQKLKTKQTRDIVLTGHSY